MPDFDIDFCQDRRDEVIRYVQERYGRDQVAQIITFGTLQARGVLRDVGRVLQMPYGQVDKLCKLVPQNPAAPVTLAQAIDGEPKLQAERDSDPVVKRAFDIARKLEGLTRHASTHAAGIVIGDRPLTELVPLYRDPKSDMPVTQFNMKWVEQAGLVKFDFLGLKTLTVLETAVELVRRRGIDDRSRHHPARRHENLRPAGARGSGRRVPTGKRRACAARCSTCGPTASRTSSRWSRSIGPGPMANIPTYCARKHGMETAGLHPSQARADPEGDLRRHHLPGTGDAGGADPRRLFARRGRSAAPRHGQEDHEGDAGAARALRLRRVERGVERYQADAIFDLLERFAEYGFNKSHAAAYALVAYQTAYMKANYPVEFLAASMTLDIGNTDKLAEFRAEAERLGIQLDPPSVNRSGVDFEVEGNTIIYALAALKGVGKQAVEAIIAARGERPSSPISPISPRASIRARSTSACWKA